MSRIVVTVSPRGDTTVETQGFTGTACQRATRELEAALGVVLVDQLTTEFFQSAAANASHTVQTDRSG